MPGIVPEHWLSDLRGRQNPLEGNYSLLGPTSGISDSIGLEWSLKICISKKFPGNAKAATLEPHLESLTGIGYHQKNISTCTQ